MNLFIKYRLQINIVLLLFWIYILIESIQSDGFQLVKFIIPIAFIVMALFNIYRVFKPKK